MELPLGKLLAAAIIGAAFAHSAAAHPGPERHPFDSEMKEADAALAAAITKGNRQVNKRIDDLNIPPPGPDQQVIEAWIESEVKRETVKIREALSVSESVDTQQVWITTAIAGGASLILGLGGGLAGGSPLARILIERAMSALTKRPRRSLGADPNNGGERKAKEREEQSPKKTKYYVNKNAKKGKHEVHRADCRRLPKVENRLPLGLHDRCHSAVAKAKINYPSADGCGICSYDCHNPD